MAGIEFSAIEKSFGATPVLRGVSASLEPGLRDRMAGLGADAVSDKTAGPADIADDVRRRGEE